jgi:phasin
MTTTAPKSAKTKSSATAPFEAFNIALPKFDMPKFDLPKFDGALPNLEVPVAFRDFAEKSIAQARDTYAKMKAAAEEATDMVEDTYETAREGAFAIGVKALDAAKTNSDASFAFAKDLFGAKTFAEVIELQSAFARKQFDAVSAQFKEIQDLTSKLVADTTKPVTAKVEKAMKDVGKAA